MPRRRTGAEPRRSTSLRQPPDLVDDFDEMCKALGWTRNGRVEHLMRRDVEENAPKIAAAKAALLELSPEQRAAIEPLIPSGLRPVAPKPKRRGQKSTRP